MFDQIGLAKNQLDTPALCIDLDKMEGNVQTVVDQCRRAGVAWRPHAKCHKSPVIAKKLIDAGASGITCAKLGEAEVMAAAGIDDLLIANLIVGPLKLRRLAALCRLGTPIVCVDHPDQVAPMGQAMIDADTQLRVLVEVDIGLLRAGVAPGREALELARVVANTPGLELHGVMGYEGHLLQVSDPLEKQQRIRQSIDLLVQSAEGLRDDGLPCPVVSCGGTGSYRYTIEHPGVTEVQAGGAIFMDQFYRGMCHVDGLANALTVVSTVVSCPRPGRVIIDAGRKTLDSQICLPHLLDHSGVDVEYLSAEHGVLRATPDAVPMHVGQRVELIPGYVDFTTVLHDMFHVIRDDQLVALWPLEARGRLR